MSCVEYFYWVCLSFRLYALAVMTGYRRGQRQQHPQTSILKIQGSLTRDDGAYYVGKKCAYVYKVIKCKLLIQTCETALNSLLYWNSKFQRTTNFKSFIIHISAIKYLLLQRTEITKRQMSSFILHMYFNFHIPCCRYHSFLIHCRF